MKERVNANQSTSDRPQQDADQGVPIWQEAIQRDRERWLNRLLFVALALGAVGTFVYAQLLPESLSEPSSWRTLAPFLLGLAITLILTIWRGPSYVYRSAILIFTVYFMACFIFARSGLSGSGRLWLLLIPVLSFILIGPRSGVFTAILSVLTYAIFAVAIDQQWIVPWVSEDLTLLLTPLSNFLIIITVISTMLWSFHQVWIEAMQKSEQTKQNLHERSSQLADINEALERQAAQLRATADVNRAVSAILDPKRLLDETVNRIQSRFSMMDVYHVGLYLLDESGQFAELKAATGEAGRLSLEMGYKLKVDESSTIGWSIVHQSARVSQDLEEQMVQIGPLAMPHTRAEIVLPLHTRGNIIGALSMQSSRESGFRESDIAILQAMADQVALSIDNARLFSQTETMLEEVQAVQRRYLTQAWKDFLAMEAVTQAEYVQPNVEVSPDPRLRQAQHQAARNGESLVVGETAINPNDRDGPTALVVPLKLREEVIGTLTLNEVKRQRTWSSEDIAMAEAIAEQTALTIDNLRLFQEIQRRAARERLIGEVTAHMRESLDVDTVLKTAAQQIREGLGLHDVSIQLEMVDEQS
ncbi:MAG TPA: GAF domain-containing protein [Chloroflexi bacterium]|nr:GAF domain-containing protein [Chloroflexota bacterium]